jgi:hypothetical protein
MSDESQPAWQCIGEDDPVTDAFRWRLKRLSQQDDFGEGYRAGRRWLVKEANVFETTCLARYLGGSSMQEVMQRASSDYLNGELPEAIAHRLSGSDDWNWGWLEGALTHLHELEQRTGFKV